MKKRWYWIKYRLTGPIHNLFEKLESVCSEISNRTGFCPDCGRNKYYGKPCVGEKTDEKD